MVYSYQNNGKVYVLIKYIAKHDIMIMYWLRAVDNAEIAEVTCELALEVAGKFRPRYVINDNRDQDAGWPDIGNWLVSYWIPTLAASGVTHFAHIFSPSLGGRIAAKSIFNHNHSGIIFKTFFTSTAASNWLKGIKTEIDFTISHDSLFGEYSVSQTVVEELNEAYSNLNMVTELANIGLWTQDLYTNEVVANDEILRMFNITRQQHNEDPFIWRTRMDAFDRSVYDTLFKKVMETKKPQKNFVFKIFPEKGQIRYLKGTIIPILDFQKQRVVKLSGLNVDITEYLENEKILRSTIDQKNKLFRELHHRIKNNLNMIVNLMSMKSMMSNDERLEEFIEDTKNRIFSIAKTHDLLLRFEEKDELSSKRYFEDLTSNLIQTNTVIPGVYKVNMDVKDTHIHIDTILTLGLLLNEIVSNIIKHAYDPNVGGPVNIRFSQNKSHYQLNVADQGVGFELTNNSSFGLKLIHLFVEQLKGTVELQSNQGVKYDINIPIPKRASDEKSVDS